VEYTSNTRNLRRIRRGIDVESTFKNGHQVDRYLSMSSPRRFNVDIYPVIGLVDFLRRIDVDYTSKSICADMFDVKST